MKLQELLNGLDYTLVQGSLDTEVVDIAYDSRKVQPGWAFVCIVGTNRDSHDYAMDVAGQGASVLVIEHRLDEEMCIRDSCLHCSACRSRIARWRGCSA